MTQDKQLLMADLCARLPYGVKVQVADYKTPVELSHIDTKNGNGRKPYCFVFAFEPERVKPYLRPMSSMTEEEENIYEQLIKDIHYKPRPSRANALINWLDKNHFDHRTDDKGKTLIEKGLAIAVTEENNPYK